MAVAAATAVITPAAFLMVAPAAYATDDTPSTTESTTASTSDEDTKSADPTPSDDETTSADPAPSDDETTSTDPAPSDDKTSTTDPSPSNDDTAAPSPSTSTSAPSPSASASEPASECEDFADNEGVHTELRGLPSKVVAGSGWQKFTFRVENKTGHDVEGVDAYLYTAAVDDEDLEEMTKYVTVQAYIQDAWRTVSDEDGYFGTSKALKANQYAEANMRLKVDAKAPAGYGFAFASGVSITADGLCEYGDETLYEFDILAADTDPGEVDDATGKPGKKGNKPAPTGELSEIPVTGTLAETGSSSMLPTIGVAGGIAIVAGAGVVFALKRRNAGATA